MRSEGWRRAVPWAWVGAYVGLLWVPGSLFLALLGGLSGLAWYGLRGVAVAALGYGVVTAAVTWWVVRALRRDVGRALERGGCDGGEVLAPAFAEVRGRYRRRPAGVLLVVGGALRFVASTEQDAEADRRWELGTLERVEGTGDRFGHFSRVFDIQGGLIVEGPEGAATFSVVGCRRFTTALCDVWGPRAG